MHDSEDVAMRRRHKAELWADIDGRHSIDGVATSEQRDDHPKRLSESLERWKIFPNS